MSYGTTRFKAQAVMDGLQFDISQYAPAINRATVSQYDLIRQELNKENLALPSGSRRENFLHWRAGQEMIQMLGSASNHGRLLCNGKKVK
jgi:hypothetical protein